MRGALFGLFLALNLGCGGESDEPDSGATDSDIEDTDGSHTDTEDTDTEDTDDTTWPPAAPQPPTGETIVGLDFLADWSSPRALSDSVNTVGWEDSAFISADGTTLYYGFTPLDFSALMEGREEQTGVTMPGHVGLGFDIYEATISGQDWSVSRSSVNNVADLHEAAIGLDRDQSTMAFVRFDPEGDIFLAERDGQDWGTPEMLPAPIHSPCSEDNPHLSPDGKTLYFDSNRADPLASSCLDEGAGELYRTLYESHLDNGVWSTPVALSGGPNDTLVRWQVFVTESGSHAYWSAGEADCPALACIYRAELLGNGSFGPPELIVRPSAPSGEMHVAIGIGEISITADGRYFYFVYITQDTPGHMQLSLGVAESVAR